MGASASVPGPSRWRDPEVSVGAHQPSSGDDERILAGLGEERQLGSLASDAGLLRLVSPAGLTGAQLATGDKHTTSCGVTRRHPEQWNLLPSNPLM